MADEFFTKRNCDRCGKPLTVRTMSMFNAETICMECTEAERKGDGMEETKYEVEVSILLKGAFTVVADDESCAEEAVNRMLADGRIKVADLEPAETRVDCIGEDDEDAEPMNGDGAEDGEAGDDSP